MAVERVFRIYWGPTLENALDFTWPVVGSSPTAWRGPRDGSEQASNGASTIGWITGMYYYYKVTAQFFAGPQYAGGNGLQAFLDWAADSNAFTIVPNLATPGLTIVGCYLQGPFTRLAVALEGDASQTVDLTFLHPAQDLGLAFRGLFFEYGAGGSLTDPITYAYSRASVGYELNNQGYLTQNPAGTLCDGHYPTPFVDGLQTTLLEDAVSNDVTNPEDLTNVSWTKNFGSITANAVKAPDGNLTGDLFIEDATATAVHAVSSNGISVASTDKVTGLVFVRPAGRFNVIAMHNDSSGGAGGNKMGVQVNLHTLAASSLAAGTGVVDTFKVIDMSNGWFAIYWRGTFGTTTTAFVSVRLGDGTGNFTYTGDNTSGMGVWGATAVHGARKQIASYTPTTSVADSLTVPWLQAPQAQWDYAKFSDWSPDTDAAQTYSVLQTGDTAFTAPRAYIVKNSSSFTALHGNGVTTVSSTVSGLTINAGDVVEVLRIIDATGAVTLRVSINGGAEQVGTTSAALAFAAAWNAPILSIGNVGGLRYYYGLNRIKSGPYVAGVSPATIAAARLA